MNFLDRNLVFLFSTFGIGIVIGVLSALSFLRNEWENFQVDFFFWWSIISTISGGCLLLFSVWQYWENRSQIEKNKAQVKVWMQDANGIRSALQRVVRDNIDGRYSSTNDMANAVWSVEATAGSLYQSLYEERCVTEDEYRTRQRRLADLLDRKQFAELEREAQEIESANNQGSHTHESTGGDTSLRRLLP